MSLVDTASKVASGDHTTTHVAAVSVVGGAISTLIMWGLNVIHAPLDIPPGHDAIQAAIAVLAAIGASMAMKKLAA